MHRTYVACPIDARLDAVARLMSDEGCNLVPVVDSLGHLAGALTAQDVCRAAASHAKPLAQIQVSEVVDRHVFSCDVDDRIQTAERLMQELHIPRLTVTNRVGSPVGVLSLEDIHHLPR